MTRQVNQVWLLVTWYIQQVIWWETKQATCSHIVSNIDTSFDYLRIYSIQRTSINSIPICKRIQDIAITGSSASYVDTGLNGNTIDPTDNIPKEVNQALWRVRDAVQARINNTSEYKRNYEEMYAWISSDGEFWRFKL